MQDDDDSEVRFAAIESLAARGELSTVFLDSLDDPKFEVHYAAAEGFGALANIGTLLASRYRHSLQSTDGETQ